MPDRALEIDLGCLHQLCEARADREPGATALVVEHQRLSCGELDRRANRLARRLRELRAAPEVRVAVCLERTVDLIVALLAVLKAGAAYVPVDPAYPQERQRFLVADSRAQILLTQEGLASRFPATGATVLLVDRDREEIEQQSDARLKPAAAPGNLAYVIYTSGSTGLPKGVAIEHRSAVALLRWAMGVFSRAELAGVLAATSVCFDLSVFEIFLPLAAGGTVILAQNALALSSPALTAAGEVTLVNTVPSAIAELVRSGAIPPSVRVVNLAGEPLRAALVERLYTLDFIEKVYNLYGPSEDTTYSTWALMRRGDPLPPSIGVPLDGTRAWVLDAAMEPVAPECEGELYLAGEGLARGYLGRPELTAQRFVPDPFAVRPGERLYATGDLVRLRPSGELDFLGRFDHQVKIRGFRIELGEVESALDRAPDVADAVVVAREAAGDGDGDGDGDVAQKVLVAYVVPAPGASLKAATLRAHLRASLMEAMVPSRFVVLPALPRTPNGKVDRAALPEPGDEPGDSGAGESGGALPQSRLEQTLAEIWAEALSLPRVGVEDDFFALGGHSLTAARVVAGVRSRLGLELPQRAVFEAPTVSRMAARLAGPPAISAIVAVAAAVAVPAGLRAERVATTGQEATWFADRLHGELPMFNIPLVLALEGALDPAALERALSEVVRRHEALNTIFTELEGRPVPLPAPACGQRLSRVDLGGLAPDAARAEAARVSDGEARRPIDLKRGPLLRPVLLRLGSRAHRLLLTLHHIVGDDWSTGVLVRELAGLYAAFAAGRPSPLPALAYQYADYATWQRQWLAGEEAREQLAFWAGLLAGAPESLDLPFDRPRPATQSFLGERRCFRLEPAEAARLVALARQRGATPFMVLMAGFAALLSRYSGREDLVLAAPVANRLRPGTQELIGLFSSNMPWRLDLAGAPGLGELLARVRARVLAGAERQDVPFDRLVRELQVGRNPALPPLAQVAIVFDSLQGLPRELAPGLALELSELGNGTAKLDLTLYAREEQGGSLDGVWEYATALFDATTVERLTTHFAALLHAAVAEPERRLADLPLLTSAERYELLAAWNATARPVPPDLIHEQVAAQAWQRPAAVAVAAGTKRLTYGELDARANRLAHHLRSLGVGPETRVAVLMERTPERVIGILAVLKAGGAYLSLDPANPGERLAFQIADARSPVVLTAGDLVGRLPAVGATVLVLDGDWQGIAGREDAPPAVAVEPENLAYVIYTSGSTGTPKGVEIPHAGLANLVAWHRELYAVTAADRATLVANPGFDASVWEVWPYLAAGASLYIPEEAVRLSPAALARWWAREGITLSFLPTPLAEAVLEGMAEELPAALVLRALIVGGDRLRRGPLPGAGFRVMNHYGPSESSVVSTVETVTTQGVAAIGRPIANTRVYVLDRAGEPLPVGVAGELCVAGVGLARGYLARPELTAAAFVPDPFAAPGERLYRTGDLVRWTPAGKLDFLGRLDQQVKLRGLRIELGEIEAALARQPAVRAAAVLLREGRLVAYLSGAELAAGELKAALAERLPDYMIPAVFVALPALPLSANGKVDRQVLAALPPPEAGQAAMQEPRTPLEEALAEIWASLLDVARVGTHDDFFTLGGHSLLAMQVLSRVRRTWGVELPPRALFAAPTVAGLAAAVAAAAAAAVAVAAAQARESEAEPETAVPQRTRAAGQLPLSYAQRRLWFLDRLTPGSPAYNVPFPLRVEGCLEPALLAAALGEIVRRHHVLRSTYPAGEWDPYQVVQPAVPFPLPVVDLAGLPGQSRHGEALRLTGEDAVRPFDLAAGPVFRASLLRLGGQEHVLLTGVHHIAFDGWSLGVLLAELAALYGALDAGRPSPLPEPAWQYGDFAAWQRSWLTGETLAHLGFWRLTLEGAPDFLELPADYPRPAVQSLRGRSFSARLGAGAAAALRALGRQRGQTLFMLMLAGFQSLLVRYTGQSDLVVGSPVAGRNHAKAEGLIGFFVNILVLRGDLAGDPSFGELLARTRESCLAAYAHQDLPFEVLVEELRPGRDMSRSPLVQVLLVVVENDRRELPHPPRLRLIPLEEDIRSAKFDLTLSVAEEEGDLVLSVEYATDLFAAATAERMAGHLKSLLAGAAADPLRRLADLPLLSPAERAEALAQAGDPALSFPWQGCVHERFAAWAERTPGAVAAIYEGKELSYGELDERAGRLARRLRRLGVGPESRVGLFCERSLEMVVGLLAVLKAGGAYVPLDPGYPAEWVAFVLADAGVGALLTQTALVERLPATAAGVVLLDGGEEEADDGEPVEPVRVDPANAAYVIYTSGSTGQPKGVVVSHAEVARLFTATRQWFHFGPEDVWTLFHSYAFDFSVWEIWGALVHGGRLVVVPYWVSRAPEACLDLLSRERVTVLSQTPSAFRQLALAESAGRAGELALRCVIFGGEALEMASLAPWFDRHGDERPRLVNMYGITETTVHVTYRPVTRADLGSASLIGVPIPDQQVHVLDRAMEPSPLLVAGELHVGGAGLARGYLNRPELTAERFVPDPFGGRAGARLYRSGDLARRLPGGELAYLGRIDQQVKVRGFRIELGEIEAVLASHKAVGEAVVLALPDLAGGSRLVAYAAGPSVPGVPELRAFLKGRLPEHMVPSGFVSLPSLPLTRNGKVDRRALSRLELAVEREGTGAAPVTPMEVALARIFGEVLGVAAVGADDDFFDHGGHSLLAVRVVTEVRRALGAQLPVRAVFEHPTVAGLARLVEAAGGHAVEPRAAVPAIGRAPRDGRLPLSFPQSRLWFLDQLDPGSAAYNIPFPLHVEGPLAVDLLAAALAQVVGRHEALRTTFSADEWGEPHQVIAPAGGLAPALPIIDLSPLPQTARRTEAARLVDEDGGRPFDLARGPVLRFALLRLAAGEHLLLLSVHHIAFDGWSVGVLLRELAALYEAGAAGRPSPLPELPVQYADFAVWQRRELAAGALAGQLDYWRQRLAGAPTVFELPADHPRPATQGLRGAMRSALVPVPATELWILARREGATAFMLLLAAFAGLLHRLTGRDDLLIGTPIANRGQVELEGLVGFFVNTLALRLELAGNPATGELLRRSRETALGAYAHQDLPFDVLVDELRPERDLSRSPLVQVMLVMEDSRELPHPPGLRLTAVEHEVHPARFDLALSICETGETMTASAEYAVDLFEPATIDRLLAHFGALLAGIAASPAARLSELPLFTPAERHQLLAEWGDTAAELPACDSVLDLFAARARRSPQAVAVVYGAERLSYGELAAAMNRLARHLRRLGVGPEVPVAVAAERSTGMVVGLLGVLAAGGAYVPLDPGYPRERLAYMLEDCGAPVLVTQSRLLEGLPAFGGAVVTLDGDRERIAQQSPEPLGGTVELDSLAYVIYTSGSTGRPKGVQVAHRGLVNLTAAQIRLFDLGPGRRALQLASFSFDASVSEIFTALLSGAELHLADREELLPGPGLARLVRERGITTATLTPSTLAAFQAAMPDDRLDSISTLVVAGEACPGELAARWSRGRRFLNAYGPTEATVCASAEVGYRGGAPTLGQAIANTRLLVLDAALEPVPAGVLGEIAIAGVGLARGYRGRPDLTAERFVPAPVAGEPGARLYRTGDRGRFLADGRLEFLGRVDYQIKVRGFRIEPGEVEAALLRLPGLREAVVMAREDVPGDRRLVAYVVSCADAGEEAPVPAELRRALLAELPEHMVPSAVVVLPALPLTPNGKLDRQALPRPEDGRTGLERPFVAPNGPLEEMVAGIWCEVLGREQVGADDAFFDLGGHSLLATQVISRLRGAFGVDLPVRALFEAPTVARLAARVEAARLGPRADGAPAITAVARDGRGLCLSFAQSRLWLLDRLEPGSPLYNLPQAVALSGALNRPALEAALAQILSRHEVLRTRFVEEAGEAVQLVQPAAAFTLPLVDLAGLAGEAHRLAEAGRLAGAEAGRPFDLSQPPLLRALLLRLAPAEHQILLTLHHIASDGWSQAILMRELTALYSAFAAARSPLEPPLPPSPASPPLPLLPLLPLLPPLPLQYPDFAAWQRNWLAGATLAAELDHWRRRLAAAPDLLDLPTDWPRPPVRSSRGAELGRALPPDLTRDLARLARQEGATLFMLLLAAFDVLLFRYTRQEDFLVGSPIANRNRAETEGLIGFFVNTLVLRADLTGAPDFHALLRRTREVTLEAYEHQDLPFEKLVEELHPERSLSHTPLFQVMLVLQNAPDEALELPGLTVRPLPVASTTAKFDLTLFVEERDGQLQLSLEYSTDLFAAATIERLLSHLVRLLAGVVAAPQLPVAELPLLGAQEAAQILVEWNDTAVPPARAPDTCLHQLFEAQARRTPGAVALVGPDGGRLTYRELEARAESLVRRLRALGVGPEILAGVMMDRTADLVVALLAVLKAGGAYVPIDPAYPPQRVAFMLESSGAAVLLTRRALLADFAGSLPPAAVPLFLDPGWEWEPTSSISPTLMSSMSPMSPMLPAIAPVGPVAPVAGNLAYIIYTSGSTGTPKGVALEHRSAVVFARWAREVFPPEDLAAVLAATSVCFDLSVFEIFVTLSWGGAVVLADNALALPAHPAAGEVTLVNTVPSVMAELVRGGGVPPSVRTVNLAGEALKGSLVRGIYERTGVLRVHNLYGPSEDTTYSTFAVIPREVRHRDIRDLRDIESPPIGRPLAGTSAYVLDATLAPVPVGVPGTVYLSGLGLARGYLGRPELTADRFIPDPFGPPGARLYRVGDLARFRPDGALDFLGRVDHQVKVRGFRIELGEIEAALAGLETVKQGAVLALPEPGGEGSRLTAFVVPATPAVNLAAELRTALKKILPAYMVPTAFTFLAQLPLTPNGKLDRRALERLAPGSEQGAAGSGAPRTPLEELVAGLWCEVLGIERAGVDDSFFDLGGHSLLATRVISRLRQTLGVELPLRALFEAPTVAALARRVETARAGGRGPAIPPLQPVPRDGRGLPLSHSQRSLWLVDRLEPGSAQYNIPQALELRGDLDAAALAAALAAIVCRHEVLRTRFTEVEGEPVQIPEPAPPSVLRLVDLSGLPDERERREEAGRLGTAEAMRAFDLARPPLLRAILLRLGRVEHRLLLTVHHIASDGWSQGILERELAALYAAFVRREPSPLPAVPLHYGDFAAWQRSWLAGEALDRELAWWKESLAGAPDVLDLPADRPRPAARSSRGAHLGFDLAADTARGLKTLARREGVTPFMALLAAFEVLLYRYSGQEGFLVGSPIANRNRAETEDLVGFFVNTLVLRAGLEGDPDFRELLRRTREVTLDAHEHQDVPFEKLVEELRPGRSLSHTPLFQVMLVTDDGASGLAGSTGSAGNAALSGLAVRPLPVESGTAKFDLTLGFYEVDGGQSGVAEYSTELFDAVTVERLTGHLSILLAAALEAPERRIGELPLLSEEERRELLVARNDTRRDFGPLADRVHEQVREQARCRPQALAVVAGRERLTYGELEARTNRLAHHLRSLGVRPESRVAVFMERSPERVVAVLAVLKAGGAYVSLDPGHPPERLAFQIADAGSLVVLTQDGLAGRLPELTAAVLRLDGDWSRIAGREDEAPAVDLLPESLAYVIYTSGSTGIPKGVEIPHQGLSNLVAWHRDLYQVTPADRATLIANPAFDASVWEIWPYLTAGASLHVPDETVRVTPDALLRWFAAEGITLSFLPTLLGEAMLEEKMPADLALRAMILGGDRLHRRSLPGALFRLMNHYGPTEVSVVTTVETVAEDGLPAIGRPLPNLRVYVLDRAGQPAPVGVPGELCVAGVGLARGYLARPELTAEKFVPEPFSGGAGERMYRTGDLARWGRDGKVEFLGRLDHQVKMRGLRIELGEIEAALGAHPAVRETSVLLREGRLVAYLSPAGAEGLQGELRAFLAERLPEYMLPAAFVMLVALPLTASGKVDRQALAALPPPSSAGDEPAAPRTPLEAALAAIWAELLGLEQVGVHDNFFELGGHSLLATRLVSRIRSALGVDLPLMRLFGAPTVAGLAALIAAGSWPDISLPPIVRVPRPAGDGLPLSFGQQRLWLLDQVEPGVPVFNVPTPLRIRGPLDVPALSAAVSGLTRRHEALRTIYLEAEGHPFQRVLPAAPVPLPVLDLSALPAAACEVEARHWASDEGRLPFDLARGPVFRASLVRLQPEEHILCLTTHHIATDGWSSEIVVGDLLALYEAARAGRPSPLPEPAPQYPDFAVWQRRSFTPDVSSALLIRWQERFGTDLPVLRLPTDRPRPAVQTTTRGDHRSVRLPLHLTQAARALASRRGASLFMTFLAAFQALLHRYSGQERIVVGSPIAGRSRPELEGMVGFFVNTVVLPVDVAGDLTFSALVERVRDAALVVYACQDLPFDKLVDALQPERDRSRSPLFQVMFTFQDGRTAADTADTADAADAAEAADAAGAPPLALEPLEVANRTSQFDLSLFTADLKDALWVGVEYNTDLFDAVSIDRLLDHYGRLLAAAVEAPETRIAELPPAAAELPRPAADLRPAPAPIAPDGDARRDRLAARMSKLSPAQREALERRLRGGGVA